MTAPGVAIFLVLTSNLFALTPIFPLKDIRPGQRGIGKTVFSGDKIANFQVEILGVLEDLGPKQSIILARLSGGPLAETGVLEGMSGSPVYIDGKLVGAVALSFSYSKEPIAGIRPIEDMLPIGETQPLARAGGALPRTAVASLRATGWQGLELPVPAAEPRPGGLIDISTPASFSGFTEATIDHFAPQLRKLGLEPRQGIASGGHLPPGLGNPSLLHPGSMITVQLLSGDMSIAADGTVTEIDGKHIYAFGHHFLSVGGTNLPFARASVITVLPNVSASFKISSAQEWMGTITEDRSTSIYGELGQRANTVPLSITLQGAHGTPYVYRMQMVNDRVLSPFILQSAIYSAIDATQRTVGMSSFALSGQIDFQTGIPPLKLDNTYAGDSNVAQIASLGVAAPLAYLMSTGFTRLKVRSITLHIDASERKRVLQVDQVAVSRREVRPGEPVELAVTLSGENGVQELHTVQYHVPVGAPLGMLRFTVSDAASTNLAEYQQILSTQPRSPNQVVSSLNGLHPNTNVYVRVWRADPAYEVEGRELPDPPPSIALLLAKSRAGPAAAAAAQTRGSTVQQLQIDTGDAVISGSKTIQVEVKE